MQTYDEMMAEIRADMERNRRDMAKLKAQMLSDLGQLLPPQDRAWLRGWSVIPGGLKQSTE